MYQHRSSISETLFSPIHIKTHYQLIYALSITVCFVTKGFKVVLTGKIVFTLLSCHPLILFTISWIANTKKNNKVLNIYYPRYTCCSPIMKNVFLYHCITWYINYHFLWKHIRSYAYDGHVDIFYRIFHSYMWLELPIFTS